MKRALLAILGAFVLLLAVLAVRAASLRSFQLDVEPAPAVEIDPAPIGQRLAMAVRERTISSQDPDDMPTGQFLRLHTLLRVAYPRTHRTLELEKLGLSLLYTWRGSDPSLAPIVFAAHQDVVPVDADSGETWTRPPFQGVVEDGVVWGRGTIDDKAAIISLLDAVERLIGEGFQPARTVHLAFGHDEEVGGHEGAAAIAERLAEQGVRPAWVLDEGGLVIRGFLSGLPEQVAVVGVSEKGSVGIALDLEAPGGHSSTPPRRTAVGDLARAVVALEENPMPARLDGTTALLFDTLAPELSFPARMVLANRWLFEPLMLRFFAGNPALDAMVRTTTAVTIFEAGVKENVLPTRARAIANFRIHPGDDVDAVAEHVRRTVDDERISLQVGVRSPPRNASPVSPVDSDAYREIAGSIRAVFPDTIVLPYLLVAGSDARHYHRVTDHVYRFLPFTYGPEALGLSHGIDERIETSNLAQGVRFYLYLLRRAAGQSGS